MGVALAAIGAALPVATYFIARDATGSLRLGLVCGLVAAFWFPLIALGGYLLSDVPFAAFLASASALWLAALRRGNLVLAFCSGCAAAAAFVFRPQLIVSVVLYAALGALSLRRARERREFAGCGLAVAAAIPLLVVMVISAVRFTDLTGRAGLIAGNVAINRLFSACHVERFRLVNPLGEVEMDLAPPEFVQAWRGVALAPSGLLIPEERNITLVGTARDPPSLRDAMNRCNTRRGLSGVVLKRAINVSLLFFGSIPWPISTEPTKSSIARSWEHFGLVCVVLPGFFSLTGRIRKGACDRARLLSSVHILAILSIAVVFFGSPRLRAAYDPFFLVLACATWSDAHAKLKDRLLKAGTCWKSGAAKGCGESASRFFATRGVTWLCGVVGVSDFRRQLRQFGRTENEV
jgi:4-amino-4-deoxy-L-arabinose transferase-like glycosyltransferase